MYSESVAVKNSSPGAYFETSSLKYGIRVDVRTEAVAVIHLKGRIAERITTLRVTSAVTN